MIRTRSSKFQLARHPAVRKMLTEHRLAALEKGLALLHAQRAYLAGMEPSTPALERANELYPPSLLSHSLPREEKEMAARIAQWELEVARLRKALGRATG